MRDRGRSGTRHPSGLAGTGQGRERDEFEPGKHTDRSNEADTGGGLVLHDLERRTAGDRTERARREGEVAEDVQPRRRRVDTAETAARRGTDRYRPPHRQGERDVEDADDNTKRRDVGQLGGDSERADDAGERSPLIDLGLSARCGTGRMNPALTETGPTP